MPVFDEILSAIDESDREVLIKYPQIKEKFEREIEPNLDYAARMSVWQKNHWDAEAMMTKESKAEIARRDARIAELQGKVDTEMTFDQINAELVKTGYVRASDVDTKITSVFARDDNGRPVKDSPLKPILDNQAASMEHVFTETLPLVTKYAREFNDDLDVKKLYKHMNEKGIRDFNDGYTSFIKPKMDEREAKKRETDAAEIERKLQEATERGKDLGRQEAIMQQNGRLPTDQNGPGEIGPLQARKAAKAEEARKANGNVNANLGDNLIAYQMYEQYMKDSASGKVN